MAVEEASGHWVTRTVTTSAKDFFLRVFPVVFITHLCTETNRYFTDWVQLANVNKVTKQAWVDVDVAEMKAFIAMFILMGLSRRRSYKVHWTTHWLLAVPGMRTVMARDRFFTHFEVFTFDKQC